jgi:hypothetical protein
MGCSHGAVHLRPALRSQESYSKHISKAKFSAAETRTRKHEIEPFARSEADASDRRCVGERRAGRAQRVATTTIQTHAEMSISVFRDAEANGRQAGEEFDAYEIDLYLPRAHATHGPPCIAWAFQDDRSERNIQHDNQKGTHIRASESA